MSNFTQEAIFQAFGEMLERMPFEKITVSGLIQECGISRNTFYYHFQDVYDLLDQWVYQTFYNYISPEIQGDWRSSVYGLLRACQEHKKLVYHLFDSLSRDRMEQFVFSATDDVLMDYIRSQDGSDRLPEKKIIAISNICRYSIIGYFLYFLWSGMTHDVKEATKEIGDLLEEFIAHEIEITH